MESTAVGSSSGSQGLLRFVLLLDGQGGARRLALDQTRQWRPEQGQLWIHLDPRSSEDEIWLHESSGLSPPDLEALRSTRDRARLEFTGPESMLAILDTAMPSAQGDLRPRQDPLALWAEPHRLLSYGSPPRPAIESCRAALESGKGASSLLALQRELIHQALGKVSVQVAELDDALSALEGALRLDKPVSLSRLHEMRRRAVQLRYQTEPLRDLLAQFRTLLAPWFEKEAGYWREFANRAVNQVDQIDSLLHRADVLSDHLDQRTNTNTERAIYIITLLSGLFLPLSFLTGLLGVNVGGVPLKENPWGFLITCAVLLVLAVVSYRFFRRRHWV